MLYLGFFLLIGGWAAAEFVSPYMIIVPPPGYRASLAKDLKTVFQPFEITTFDGFRIKAMFRPAEQARSRAVIILAHGIGGRKEHFASLSEMLAQAGYASVVFDGRAHGESEGKYCTFGFKEKRDIQAIVHWIKREVPDVKIGIWGHSLGGAVALQALEIEPDLAFGIVQSTFADLEQIVYDYQNRILQGFGWRKLSDKALRKADKIARFEPGQVKPIAAAANIRQPVLVAHGDQDQNISVEYAKKIYQALPSPCKELIIVPGAGHANLFDVGGSALSRRFIEFLDAQTHSSY